MAIFMQGCNFSCSNCHNPETMGLCTHCGDCLPACESQALSFDLTGKIQWNEAACTQSDACTKICPINASPKILELSSLDLIKRIKDNAAFINGITFSGGEVTLQHRFLYEFLNDFSQCTDLNHLDCMIDSNGFTTEKTWEKIIPHISGAMIDLKSWSDDVHKKITSQSVLPVLKSIEFLAQHNKLEEVRLLPIKGITDYQDHLEALVSFLAALPQRPAIRINAFTPHNSVKLDHPATTEAEINLIASQIQKLGYHNLRLPAIYL